MQLHMLRLSNPDAQAVNIFCSLPHYRLGITLTSIFASCLIVCLQQAKACEGADVAQNCQQHHNAPPTNWQSFHAHANGNYNRSRLVEVARESSMAGRKALSN